MIGPAGDPKAREKVFAPSEVLGALIQFCRSHRIPLAQRAHKSVEVFGDQLALMTTINLSRGEPSVDGGTIRYNGNDVAETRQRLGQTGTEKKSPLEAAVQLDAK
jgi:hypothetical protein